MKEEHVVDDCILWRVQSADGLDIHVLPENTKDVTTDYDNHGHRLVAVDMRRKACRTTLCEPLNRTDETHEFRVERRTCTKVIGMRAEMVALQSSLPTLAVRRPDHP